MELHGFSASHWVLLVQAFPGGRGFDDVPATQVKAPVRSATHFKPAQHGAWFAPQLAPSVASHTQDGPAKSPWARCAGSDASPTVITCAFAELPGGTWQMGTLVAAATRGMAAVAANTKNAEHIVRVLGSGCRQSTLMSRVLSWESSACEQPLRFAAIALPPVRRPAEAVGKSRRKGRARARYGVGARLSEPRGICETARNSACDQAKRSRAGDQRAPVRRR